MPPFRFQLVGAMFSYMLSFPQISPREALMGFRRRMLPLRASELPLFFPFGLNALGDCPQRPLRSL